MNLQQLPQNDGYETTDIQLDITRTRKNVLHGPGILNDEERKDDDGDS